MSTPAKDVNVKFTSRDIEQLVNAFACIKSDTAFALDYEKFAAACSFANANSAKASWHTLKKKIDKVAGGGATITQPDGGESGKKRKTDSVVGAGDDGEGEVGATPTAKKRRTPAKGKATPKAIKNEDEGDGDGNGAEADTNEAGDELAAPATTPSTPKARKPRTPKAKATATTATPDEAGQGTEIKAEDVENDDASSKAAATAIPKPKGRKVAATKAKTPAKKTTKADEVAKDDGDGDFAEAVKEENEDEET